MQYPLTLSKDDLNPFYFQSHTLAFHSHLQPQLYLFLVLICVTRPCNVPRHVTARYKSSFYHYYYFLNLGRSSRGGRQKLILEIIALMVNHPSGSHQQSSRAAG